MKIKYILTTVLAVIVTAVVTALIMHRSQPKVSEPKPEDPHVVSYRQCRAENKEKILEAYQKCVADAHGNNIRCENSAISIFCGY